MKNYKKKLLAVIEDQIEKKYNLPEQGTRHGYVGAPWVAQPT